MKYLLLTLALSSCVQKVKSPSNFRIYQPDFLHLKAGVPIQTMDGIFVPQTNQTWFSLDKVERLEKQLGQF